MEYMENVEQHRHLPDPNRLSVVIATILLAYALTPFVKIPAQIVNLQLPGFLFVMRLDFSTIVSAVVAILAAAGTDWLLQEHPAMVSSRRVPHWLLPALTAWAIGIPLTTLQSGVEWWAVFALGGILFGLVLLAEYLVVDISDVRNAPATVGLTAVSFALYLILAITVKAAGMRLYSLLFILAPTLFLVVLRTLYLRLGGRWRFAWAFGIMLVLSQLVLALHYWPVSALRFGLIVMGLAYSLTSLAGGIEEERSWRNLWIEPVVMLVIVLGIAILVRG